MLCSSESSGKQQHKEIRWLTKDVETSWAMVLEVATKWARFLFVSDGIATVPMAVGSATVTKVRF
jgi:hypothetical protein